MLRTFIISLCLLASGVCRSQGWLADSLLLYEYNYFKDTNGVTKQQALLQKVNLYLRQGVTGPEVLKEMKRVHQNQFGHSKAGSDLLWNTALVAYLNGESNDARFYFESYRDEARDSSVTANLLALLIYKDLDSSLAQHYLSRLQMQDTLFAGLHCFADILHYARKHLSAYLLASAIVPGLGETLNGYPLKGLVALAITSASAFAIVKMVQYSLYINAVLWGTGVGLKFYLGNINLTEKLFYKAEDKQKNKLNTACELILKSVLQKYPLTLKH